MLNNKKRKDTTYLKIKDGKVMKTSNAYPTDEDKYIDLQEKEFSDFNKEVNEQYKDPKNKKSRNILTIGLFFIFIPFLMIGFNLSKNYLVQLQQYMILGDEKTDVSTNNETELIIPSVLNKTNILNIVEVIDLVNTSLSTSYNGLKTDIIAFTNNKESIYSTKYKIQSRKDIVESNKSNITNKKALFVKNNQTELYNTFMERFDLLIKTLTSLEENISRKTVTEITNTAIEKDNLILEKEIKLLKKMLKDNNIEFTETEDGISIKE